MFILKTNDRHTKYGCATSVLCTHQQHVHVFSVSWAGLTEKTNQQIRNGWEACSMYSKYRGFRWLPYLTMRDLIRMTGCQIFVFSIKLDRIPCISNLVFFTLCTRLQKRTNDQHIRISLPSLSPSSLLNHSFVAYTHIFTIHSLPLFVLDGPSRQYAFPSIYELAIVVPNSLTGNFFFNHFLLPGSTLPD